MRRLPSVAVLVLGSAICCCIGGSAHAQGDDFDDGDASEWTELVPLSAVGGNGGTSFPNGDSYRLWSDASPDEPTFGPARIGSIREDVTYRDFYQFVDLIDYDPALDQNVGMLARVTDAGFGSTDGYAVTYNPEESKVYLSLIQDEAASDLANGDLSIAAGIPVRLVFQGKGADLKFEVFALSDLEVPLVSVEASDTTWTEGASGLLAAADGTSPVDCTFDNYFAAPEEPAGSGVISVEIDSGDLVFEFLSNPNRRYSIWESGDLVSWEELDDSIPAALDVKTRYSTPVPGVARIYYQFREMD